MAKETTGEALSSAFGFIAVAAILLGLSYLNYRSHKTSFYEGCMEEAKLRNAAVQDRVCKCAADKFIDEVSLLMHAPLVGRFFVPDDEEMTKVVTRAGAVCTAQARGG